jgi:hypothetical protein
LSKNINGIFIKVNLFYVCEMIILKEHQEALIQIYAQTHSAAEVLGYVDGLVAMLELIERLDNNNLSK